MASGSGALRAGPSGPGRGGAAIGERGRGRFISGGSSGDSGGIGGVSRLVQQRTAAEREDQNQAHDQVKMKFLYHC